MSSALFICSFLPSSTKHLSSAHHTLGSVLGKPWWTRKTSLWSLCLSGGTAPNQITTQSRNHWQKELESRLPQCYGSYTSFILRFRESFLRGNDTLGIESIPCKGPSLERSWCFRKREAMGPQRLARARGQGRSLRLWWGGGFDHNFMVYRNTAPWGSRELVRVVSRKLNNQHGSFFFF